ncbi:uncharacterized protein SCHCODRAFT_02620116 [Schizophyllum commune H4-8]|uniref:uncharacterized protein n=1 Tax=Schizophyllum commune (strain H4-8 / FGSC 9210) TaxID=578458 RepID=UPI00215F2DF6|nr:uncharacterized protein SCHCODRAFT_02620116 [Schizophyllum commune H4-8]KAI5895688.1 hypothetical protein SCHCODRAFT_02620116 [Schizophyllum commune H4-8]
MRVLYAKLAISMTRTTVRAAYPATPSCTDTSSSSSHPATIPPSPLSRSPSHPLLWLLPLQTTRYSHRQASATPSPAPSTVSPLRPFNWHAGQATSFDDPGHPTAFDDPSRRYLRARSRNQCPAQICARCVPLRPLNGAGPMSRGRWHGTDVDATDVDGHRVTWRRRGTRRESRWRVSKFRRRSGARRVIVPYVNYSSSPPPRLSATHVDGPLNAPCAQDPT